MELPLRAQQLIIEYSKPLTRPNWRKGSQFNNAFKFSNYTTIIHNKYLNYYQHSAESIKYKYKLIMDTSSITEDIHKYGDNLFLQIGVIGHMTTFILYCGKCHS